MIFFLCFLCFGTAAQRPPSAAVWGSTAPPSRAVEPGRPTAAPALPAYRALALWQPPAAAAGAAAPPTAAAHARPATARRPRRRGRAGSGGGRAAAAVRGGRRQRRAAAGRRRSTRTPGAGLVHGRRARGRAAARVFPPPPRPGRPGRGARAWRGVRRAAQRAHHHRPTSAPRWRVLLGRSGNLQTALGICPGSPWKGANRIGSPG